MKYASKFALNPIVFIMFSCQSFYNNLFLIFTVLTVTDQFNKNVL